MKLTEKQKRFCDYYIETGSAMEGSRLIISAYSLFVKKANLAAGYIGKSFIQLKLDKIE
ncbi:hypothetical protein [Bacillus gobiensis]|uniref:hypothetical protein n=1 Tax=Bacillus gobiensis TaxID=1441095 RepID=UPI003D218EC1